LRKEKNKMIKLKLGDLDNKELKFIPTKIDSLNEYLKRIDFIMEYEIIQTFDNTYKYRMLKDNDDVKYTKNKKYKTKSITKVVEISPLEFNNIMSINNKSIKKIRKCFIDGNYKIDVDYFSLPFQMILVEVSSTYPLCDYNIPKGFIDVTSNSFYQNKNIYNGSIISTNTIIEGSDGVGKSITIEKLLDYGIICQDRSNDVISKYMMFDVSMEERVNHYHDYLKNTDKRIIFMINNDKDELLRRINSREEISDFDLDTVKYNQLYLDTYNYMKERNLLCNKLIIVDVSGLSIFDQVSEVKKLIMCNDWGSL